MGEIPEVRVRYVSLHHHSGLCQVRWLGIGRPPKPWCERMYAKISIGDTDECWPWIPAMGRVVAGYPRLACSMNFAVNIPGHPRQMGAPRWLWFAERGDIPDNHDIDHICEKFFCMNIQHMQCVPSLVNQGDLNKERGVYRRRTRDAKGRYLKEVMPR